MKATVANTINLMYDTSLAQRYWEREMEKAIAEERERGYGLRALNFSDVQKSLLKVLRGQVYLNIIPGLRPNSQEDYSWLQNLSSSGESRGVYAMRLSGARGVQHATALDIRTIRSLIYDCTEQYPMRLAPLFIRICCGEEDPSKLKSIDDVWRVVPCIKKQEDRKKGKKRSRSRSYAERKKSKELKREEGSSSKH